MMYAPFSIVVKDNRCTVSWSDGKPGDGRIEVVFQMKPSIPTVLLVKELTARGLSHRTSNAVVAFYMRMTD